MTILIPHYRTARRPATSVTPISVLGTYVGPGGSGTGVTFSGVSAGELLVIIAVHTSTLTTPSGYSVAILAEFSSGNSVAVMYTKTAAGGEGASGTLGIPSAACGYRLSHGTITYSSNSAASATSISAGASALNPGNGSVMFAASGMSGPTSAPGASNSFTISTSNTRGIIATRTFATGASSQNSTLSWTTVRNVGAFLALVSP